MQSFIAFDWSEPAGARDQQPIRLHSRRFDCRIPAESMSCVASAQNTRVLDDVSWAFEDMRCAGSWDVDTAQRNIDCGSIVFAESLNQSKALGGSVC